MAEFRTLHAKRDRADSAASTLAEYLAGTPGWTIDEDVDYGTLLTHAESIALDASTFIRSMQENKDQGVNYLAPPIPLLVTLDEQQNMFRRSMQTKPMMWV